MYHNKQQLAEKLYSILEDIKLDDGKIETNINNLLNPAQKYSLIMQIIKELPMSDLESVISFHRAFKVPLEETHIIKDFKYNKLRFKLILEETLELGFALGFDAIYLYNTFTEIFNKVQNENIEPSLTNIFDALLDLLVVTNGTIDVFNLTEIQHVGMQEVYLSNMSKLLPYNENTLPIVKKSIEQLTNKGHTPISENLKNGFAVIKEKLTGKILKPKTYKKPDLAIIVQTHLNQIVQSHLNQKE